MLTLAILPPIDIFLEPSDVETYALIHNYLISIRATHLRLSNLWKLTIFRRTPLGDASSASMDPGSIDEAVSEPWERLSRRTWVTASSAVLLVGELWAYVQGEVVARYGRALESMVPSPELQTSRSAAAGETKAASLSDGDRKMSPESPSAPGAQQPFYDPEALVQTHAAGLRALVAALLLTDARFPAALHALFTRCDRLAALLQRLAESQHTMRALTGVEGDGGARRNVEREQRELCAALSETRVGVDEALKAAVRRLREIDRHGLTVDVSGRGGESDADEKGTEEGQGEVDGLDDDDWGVSSLGQRWDSRAEDIGSERGLERLLTRLDLGSYDSE